MEGKHPTKNSLFGLIVTLVATVGYREFFTTVVGPIVEIKTGLVESIVSKSREGTKYYEFLGIPYATPPVGYLRFEPPKPLTGSWEGIRKGNKYGSECIQAEVMVTGRIQGEEDCLYLNVFTPRIEKNPKRLFPVMVYIHGGLFMAGSSNMYRAKYFMENQDTILVTFNYRLAALGFLNTGDEVVRGNMGLKDQHMALRWVQENIQAFGGDPKHVTLFGESAGGASVHYHILSPASKGLFQKALSQSGTALKPWALTKDPVEQARRFGLKLGCPTNSSAEIVACLKEMDARKLVQVHLAVMDTLRDPYDTFVPTVESVIRPDTFLAEDPHVIVKNGRFNPVPWMTGVNAGEGLFNLGRLLTDHSLMERLNRDWETIAPAMLSYDASTNHGAAQEIKSYYFGGTANLYPLHAMENFTKLFSDRNFFQGTHKAAKIHSKAAPVYLYYLSYAGEISLFNLFKWISPQVFLPVEVQVVIHLIQDLFHKHVLGVRYPNLGPSHADELPLLFNMHYFAEIGKESKDYEMSKGLVKLWTDFAKDNQYLKYKNTRWEAVNSNQTMLKYMNLNNEEGGLIEEPFLNRLQFWDSLNLH